MSYWIDFNLQVNLGREDQDNWVATWAIACHTLWYWKHQRSHVIDFITPTHLKENINIKVQNCKNNFGWHQGNGYTRRNSKKWLPPID